MNIEIKNKNYWVFFRYSPHTDKQRITECVFMLNGKLEVSSSIKCHYKDKFIKETGRKITFEKCLDLLGLNKEERKSAWDQYLNRK